MYHELRKRGTSDREPLLAAARQWRGQLAGGGTPDVALAAAGCAFALRCPLAEMRCRAEAPALRVIEPGREAACHFA